MRPFAKQANCPAPQLLCHYHDGTLSVLARQSIEAHLAACDFCAAAAALLATQRQPTTAHVEAAPPVPLALRLLAQTLLPNAAARPETRHRRAA